MQICYTSIKDQSMLGVCIQHDSGWLWKHPPGRLYCCMLLVSDPCYLQAATSRCAYLDLDMRYVSYPAHKSCNRQSCCCLRTGVERPLPGTHFRHVHCKDNTELYVRLFWGLCGVDVATVVEAIFLSVCSQQHRPFFAQTLSSQRHLSQNVDRLLIQS